MLTGIFIIAIGVVGLLMGIFGDEFYSTDIVGQASLGEKLPKKSAQAFCIVVGLCCIAVGVKALLSPS